MNELEFTGKNIDEAKKNAAAHFGLSEEFLEFTVISTGKSGILGIRSSEAKVRARIIEDMMQQDESISKLPKKESREDKEQQDDSSIKEAKKILEDLVGLLGLDAKIKLINDAGAGSPAVLNLEGDDLGVLIGRRGQALAALQYIVRLIISEKFKSWTSINIDVAGYKKKRYESLKKLALRLADHVKITKRAVNLEPMPPDERRIIHVTLADNPDVTTHSIDEGERRKVVIQYRKH